MVGIILRAWSSIDLLPHWSQDSCTSHTFAFVFVSRAHRWASKPLREVLSFFRPWGIFSKLFFFRAAADVFFGRAASVGTCECRTRLTGGRDGCRRFARRPHNTPVRASCRVSSGICCAAPHGERCSATVHAVSSCVLARVRTAAAARGAYCSNGCNGWSAGL